MLHGFPYFGVEWDSYAGDEQFILLCRVQLMRQESDLHLDDVGSLGDVGDDAPVLQEEPEVGLGPVALLGARAHSVEDRTLVVVRKYLQRSSIGG